MRYRYRIEPTPAQQTMLARVFGCCRVVFNDALRVRDEASWAGIKLSDSEIQRRVITAGKTPRIGLWLCEVPSVALVQSVNDSRRAWRNFFDSPPGKRKGRKLGRPRMKSRKDHRQSFRLTRNGFSFRPTGGCMWPRSACASALVSRPTVRTVERHNHPRTRRALLREFRGRRASCSFASAGARGRSRSGAHPVSDDADTDGVRTDVGIQSTWGASSASWRDWNGRSPAGRRDRTTGTRLGEKSPSRTTR